MSDYFERIESHLLDAVERRAARRGNPVDALHERLSAARSRLRGRRPGALAIGAALVLSGSAAGAVLLSGEHSRALSGVVPPYDAHGNLSVAGAHYSIVLTPSLSAGTIGWCNLMLFHDVPGMRGGGGFGGGSCPTGTPAVGAPLFAQDGSQGEGLWYVFAAPQVVAVRVAGGPTVLTRGDPRLPYGYRAAVLPLPQRVFKHGPPHLTALDATGRVIPGGPNEQPPSEPTRSWSAPQRPAGGACPLSVRRGSGMQVQAGLVIAAAVPDPGIIGHAFLSCATLALRAGSSQMLAALLVDARHPGAFPATLPDMRSVPGAVGVFTRAEPLGLRARGNLIAERVGDAWLVVASAESPRQGLNALRALRVGPIDLRLPAGPPRARANAECAISLRPLAGLQEVSQVAFLSSRGPGQGLHAITHAELTSCAIASFYYRDWPMRASVSLQFGPPGTPPSLARKLPVAGHPGVFSVAAEVGGYRNTVQRVGRAWLEVEGGSSAAAQLALLGRLRVTVARGRPVLAPYSPDPMLGVGGFL